MLRKELSEVLRVMHGTDGFFLFTLKYIYLEISRGVQMPSLAPPRGRPRIDILIK